MKLSGLTTILLLLYLGIYAALSYNGQYDVAASGKSKVPLIGLNLPDEKQWSPKGLRLSVTKDQSGDWVWAGNTGGYVFSPLILLDRKFWHPTEGILD